MWKEDSKNKHFTNQSGTFKVVILDGSPSLEHLECYNSPNWTNNHPVTPIDTPQDPQVIYGSGSDHIFEDIIPSSLGTQKAKAWEGLKSKAWRLSKPTPFLGEAEMISLHHEQPPRAAWNPGENLSAASSLFSVGGEIDSFVLAWDAVRWLTPKWYDLLHLLGVLQT